MSIQIGQEVYTVNNKTNEVDAWTYNGTLRTPDNLLVHLVKGKKYCFLPARCVFFSKARALAVAEKHK